MYQLDHSVFVAGTDTGVGKTWVSCQLLRQAVGRGRPVAAWKPVAAGCELIGGDWQNEDALLLQQAAGGWQDYKQVNPVALPLPASPHIAASQAHQQISIDALEREFKRLQQDCPTVLVEGAGGWLAPVDDSKSMADLAVALQLPVILVVGVRLGCLNHAQLTATAIRTSGLRLEGWIANCLEADMPHHDENIRWLEANLPCPLLDRFDAAENPADASSG